MKLREINGVAKQQEVDRIVRNYVLSVMEQEAPIFNFAEFYTFTGTGDVINPDITSSAGGFRTLNNPVTGVTTTKGDDITVTRKIFSDTIKTDRALIDQYGIYGPSKASDIHESSLNSGARSLARHFMDLLINGTGADNSITGLASLITGDQLVSFNSANGGELPTGNSDEVKQLQDKFIETLDAIMMRLKPSVIIGGSAALGRLKTIARNFVTTSNVQDIFGQNQVFSSFNGVPLLEAGYKKDDSTPVLGQSETCGESTTCSSLYFVKFAERDHVTLPTTETGLKVINNPKNGVFVSTDIELQYNLSIIKAKSAVRLQGIIL